MGPRVPEGWKDRRLGNVPQADDGKAQRRC
jgi:hypothetical protein